MPSSQEHEAALVALTLKQPIGERAAFLEALCHTDQSLGQRLDALLAANDERETLLESQAHRRDELHPSSVADLLRRVDESPISGQGPAASGSPGQHAPRPIIKREIVEAPDEAVGQTIGRYKLLERVGEGGFGVVYVAEQTEPVRRRVALKVIKLGMDTKQVIARFEAERQALAMMDHPNIAKIFDAGVTGADGAESHISNLKSQIPKGRPYFVMELVRGIRITDYCDQANLTTQERLDLFIKVCQAIQHAHQKGIIHRDIKPSNILVTLHDGVPVPKVIDFGIAKATEGRLTDATIYTQLQQLIGTPAYMSPEQAEMTSLDIDTRSDIYSLGVLLYELLAGSTPFDAKELMASGIDAMRKTIREKEPVRPSTRLATLRADQLTTTAKRRSAETSKLLHQVKGDLDWIAMKCLEKDRTRRYETANGLAADITRHLTNEPVVARPPSAGYRFQKAFRRNRLIFTAGAAVTLALLVGIGFSTWQATVANRARKQEASANERLRVQIGQTDQARQASEKAREAAQKATQASEQAAQAEMQQRVRSEELLQLMQVQKSEELLGAGKSFLGISLLGKVLRVNPSNHIAAAHFASGQLRPFLQPLSELRHEGQVWSAQFSPDGLRVVTTSVDKTARVWDARTGRPLSEPLRHENVVRSAQFSPDGLRVVTASHDKTARVWEVAAPPLPLPPWFLDWAEARVGRRFDTGSAGGVVPFSEQRRQWELVAARTDTNFYTRIAQWAQADPTTRAISPHATVTVPEYISRRIQENTLPSLREAVQLNPANSLAWARLALLEMKQDARQHPERLVEAQFSARQALRLEQANAEALRASGAVNSEAGQGAEALRSVERALELERIAAPPRK